jgi:hypothetical protein
MFTIIYLAMIVFMLESASYSQNRIGRPHDTVTKDVSVPPHCRNLNNRAGVNRSLEVCDPKGSSNKPESGVLVSDMGVLVSDLRERTDSKSGLSGADAEPEDIVRSYVETRCELDSARRKSMTSGLPSDYLSMLYSVGRPGLKKDIETPIGFLSRADLLRTFHLTWLHSVFPNMICDTGLSFGRITAVLRSPGRATVMMEFQALDGSLGREWTFHVIESAKGWKIFDIDPSENYEWQPGR